MGNCGSSPSQAANFKDFGPPRPPGGGTHQSTAFPQGTQPFSSGGSTPLVALPPQHVSSAAPAPVPIAKEIPTVMNVNTSKKTGEILIISFDIGTTASGCAYMYRAANNQIVFGPEIVDKWPGQEKAGSKTPSVLFYTNDNVCHPKWGAYSEQHEFSAGKLQASGLTKVEWFKLHVDPQGVPLDYLRQPGKILPEGLAVSQIYSDYLIRLHGAAMESIKAKRGEAFIANLLLEQKVQYILTVPNAWLAEPKIIGMLRSAAQRAGLITELDSDLLDFCSEPEASALQCYSEAAHVGLKAGDIFTVVDAGGGTVDMTSYEVTATVPELQMREVGTGGHRCVYSGATFIDSSFETMLDDFLKANYPHEYQPNHVRQGTKEFKSTIKLQFSHQNRENSYLFLGVPHLYDEGHVVLAWEQIESCFKPHVDAIVEAARNQCRSPKATSKFAFCTGGFGSNEYLKQSLASALPGVSVIQPEDRGSGSKAVALGACRYAMFRNVKSRTSRAWYGVDATRPMLPSEKDDVSLIPHRGIGLDGQVLLNDAFSTILEMGENVNDDEWRISRFLLEMTGIFAEDRSATVMLYVSSSKQKPRLVTDPGVELLCHVDLQIPSSLKPKRIIQEEGQPVSVYPLQILLSLARAELRAACMMEGQPAGHASVVASGTAKS